MLVSDDLDLIERARYLSMQARQPARWYEHTEVGFNYRMSNILAALGLGQLTRLDDMIKRRRAHRQRYAETLGELPGVELLGRRGLDTDDDDNCWLTCLILDPERVAVDPIRLIDGLAAHEIEARHLWKPMHLQPLYSDARSFINGCSERLFQSGLTLPSGSELEDEDINRVIECATDLLTGRTVPEEAG